MQKYANEIISNQVKIELQNCVPACTHNETQKIKNCLCELIL